MVAGRVGLAPALLILVLAAPGPGLFSAEGTPRPIKIIPREGWGAKPPKKPYLAQVPKMLTVHHTAGKFSEGDDPQAQLRAIQAYHQGPENQWPDIAYHYLIDHHGNIYKGRPDQARGDTRTDYNLQDHVLVTLMGNFEEQRPTPEQLAALTDLLAYLMQKYQVSRERLRAHGELAQTACPGKSMMAEWKTGRIQAEAEKRSRQYAYQVGP